MFCFNIQLCNPTEAADIVFSKFIACAVLIYCFRFLACASIFFVVPSHVYLRHTAFRLQTPWGWFSNLKKKTPTCDSQPFAEAGLPHRCLSLRYVCATFLLGPKDSGSISYIVVLWHVPLEPKGPKKYIYRWYCATFLLGPKDPKST